MLTRRPIDRYNLVIINLILIMNYKQALNDWISRVNKKFNDGELSIMEGRKFDRIVKTDISARYAYCFIDKSNGDVLKTASWSKPAPTARGNIYKIGLEGVDKYGAYYRYR